jgi:hypothetical protein
MRHQGIAKLDKRTKDLVQRLGPDDIAIIDHIDMDRVSAEALLATGVEVVVNAAASISGAYPNVGPLLLTRGGVTLIDAAGPDVFENLSEALAHPMQARILRLICEWQNDNGLELSKSGTAAQKPKNRTAQGAKDSRKHARSHQDQ